MFMLQLRQRDYHMGVRGAPRQRRPFAASPSNGWTAARPAGLLDSGCAIYSACELNWLRRGYMPTT